MQERYWGGNVSKFLACPLKGCRVGAWVDRAQQHKKDLSLLYFLPPPPKPQQRSSQGSWVLHVRKTTLTPRLVPRLEVIGGEFLQSPTGFLSCPPSSCLRRGSFKAASRTGPGTTGRRASFLPQAPRLCTLATGRNSFIPATASNLQDLFQRPVAPALRSATLAAPWAADP